MSEVKVTLDEVKKAETVADAYEDLFHAKRDVYFALLVAYLESTFGCHKGDLVTVRGEVCKVHKISKLWGYDKPWIEVIKKTKSGEWGSREWSVYEDWQPHHPKNNQ